MTTEKSTAQRVTPEIPTPVIPDGGLGEALPEWLRTTPSWTRAPEVPRGIPPPDTSVIDPATLVTIDDLPAWLQAIAARSSDGPAVRHAVEAGIAAHPSPDPRVIPSETPRIDAMMATTRAAAVPEPFDGQVESDVLIETTERGSAAPVGQVGRFQVSEGMVIILLAVVGVLALACLILLMSLTFR